MTSGDFNMTKTFIQLWWLQYDLTLLNMLTESNQMVFCIFSSALDFGLGRWVILSSTPEPHHHHHHQADRSMCLTLASGGGCTPPPISFSEMAAESLGGSR